MISFLPMRHEPKDRVWLTAGGVFLASLYFALVCGAREMAIVKALLRDFIALPNEETDRAIELLTNRRLFSLYCLYSVAQLTSVPLLLGKLRWRLRVLLPLLIGLHLPAVWYGNQVIYLSMKIVDWGSVLERREADEPPAQAEPSVPGKKAEPGLAP